MSECGATFERGYGGANQEYCNDIQQLNDCGYIACGYTKSYGNQNYFDMYLLRMNAEGDTVWTRHYGVDNHEYTSSVLPTEDGGFLVFGHGTPEGSFDQDFILFKTNKFGDELWSKRYGGSGNETSQEMISVDNNSFLLMGSTTSYGPTSESIYVINVDSLGDTLWTKVISKTDYDLPESIISISDGGYLITGSGSFPRSIVLVKMDTNGDTVWTRNYGPSGCGDFGGSAVETNDNGFMVFFRPEGFSCGFSSIGILKVDSLGDSLWIKNYSRWETAVAVVPESDTTFLLTGYQINSATGAYNLYLMKINDNGDSLFSRFFAETSYSVGNSIRRTLDGGFVIAGSANNFSAGGYDSYFLKINSLYDSICNVKAAVIPDVLSICAGDSVRFDNNSYGSNSYQWLENNVAFSTDTNIVRQFNATGIYTISLIATDSVCIDTSNVDIQVTKAYVDLGADTSICKGEIVVLDAGSGFEYYLWSNAATSQSIGEDTLGDYYVLVIDSNGCTAKDTVIINNLFAKPIINLGNDTSFCLGNTINLEVDSLYVEYMWSNASTSQGIVADTLGNYFVMVTDSNGCTGEDTLEIINLFTNPVIDLGNDTSFCQGKTITLEVITLFDNYMWSDGSTSQSTTANSSGVYFLQILDTNNCMSSDTIIVNVANCDSVWPGDCNYNGKVHWNDLFLLGRYYGKQGLTRAITGSLWQAYDSDSWSDSTKRGVDLKHLDCDGSGKLNRKDATAVRDNYKKSHAKSPAHQNNPANPDLYFEILSGDIAPGTTVEIAIMLGRDTISALPVYGMGFEINVDKTMIQNNSLDIKFDQGIFSIDTNNISIVIGRDTISSTIIGAVTRTDTIDITGFGEIGRLKFTIDSNAVVGSSLGLQILNSGGVINIGDSTDYFHPPGEADTSITVNPPDGITESFSYSKFKLYPNPSDKSVSFDLPNDLLGSKYEFMNNIGQVVLSGNLTSKSVNVSRLQQGLYHVKVYSSKGIYYQKLEILR
ncbi:MAG: T9SS type A sorting domain-containing protein [Alphaproteobacteria bacterium]|nr:T9SS type A sorting domain-containing protein [Alphaproteobacteria bacterium]